MKSKDYRIFYFSELHGSYLCFYKVINLANCKDRPNIIIIGGDICGNKIVPICKTDNSNRNKFISSAKYEGKDILFENYDIQNRFVEFIS